MKVKEMILTIYWLLKCIKKAKKEYDGHFTLLKFTTNWRFCFGTMSESSNPYISMMTKGKTLLEVLKKGYSENVSSFDVCRVSASSAFNIWRKA